MSPQSKKFAATVLGIAVLALASCGRNDGARQADIPLHISVLNDQHQPLRDDFNRDKGYVRLMFLVDPTCPDCLRGLADMENDVFAKLPKGARVKAYIVHEPVIGGSDKDIPVAAELLHTTLVRHYWNPTGDFGRQMSNTLELRHGDRPVYAWDVWMIYPPDAVWTGKTPPRPIWLMHQLAGLLGNPKFPFLDSKVFAAKVTMALATPDSYKPRH